MVVFNLVAVPVLLVIAALGYGLAWLAPTLMEGPYGELVWAGIALVVSLLGELVGLRARLFFLPVWLVAIAVGAWQGWALFGVVGLAAGGGLLALAIGGFGLIVARELVVQDRDAPAKLVELENMLADPSTPREKLWESLNDVWVPPAFGAPKPERVAHLARVIALLRRERARLGIAAHDHVLAVAATLLSRAAEPGAKPLGVMSEDWGVMLAVGSLVAKREAFALAGAERDDVERVAKKLAVV
jgi:hypothetical protein